MKIRYPSEEIEEFSHSLKVVKGLIEARKNIPSHCQIFVADGKVFEGQPKYTSRTKTLDLIVTVLERYMICSDRHKALATELGYTPLIPPGSVIQNRSINDLQFTPKFNAYSDPFHGKKERKEKALEDAKPYLESFAKYKKQRLDRLREITSKLQTDTYVISTCNSPFIILLRNFIASCDQNDIPIRKRLIMFPMDKETDEVCTELGLCAYFEEGVYGETTSIHNHYADQNFRICMFLKNAMVQDMLELDKDLLVQDIDMVWLKDPVRTLERIAKLNAYDFMFMNDGPNPWFEPLHFNTGFGFISNNAFTKRTWQVIFENYHIIYASGSQQKQLNIVLNCFREKGLRTHHLDELEFLNGHKILKNRNNDGNINENTYVVHCSWTPNLSEKMNRLKENNLWYLD